jgi:ferritin
LIALTHDGTTPGDAAMMISPTMNARLNEQMMAEFFAAQKYLAMACAFERMGLKVFARRFMEQYQEEQKHAWKIMRFIHDVGGTVTIEALPKPPGDYAGVEAVVGAALGSEQEITRRIHELVRLADAENDYTTRSFLQWYVDEQVEEIASMTDLLHLVRLAGSNVLQAEARLQQLMADEGKKS